jgi:hypothetical protein
MNHKEKKDGINVKEKTVHMLILLKHYFLIPILDIHTAHYPYVVLVNGTAEKQMYEISSLDTN